MPVEESWAAMEARRYCQVTCRGWSHHHSLSPPTRQHYQLNNREAGPSNARHTELQSKTPVGGGPLCAWMGGATEKDWPKRPSDHQLQEARKKDSDRAITPAAKAVRVPAHQHRQGPHKPSSWATFMLNSHWGRAATSKKSLASMHTGSLWLCPTLCNPVDCGLPGFSVREAGGILQARILECISQYWLPNPSRALYFWLP